MLLKSLLYLAKNFHIIEGKNSNTKYQSSTLRIWLSTYLIIHSIDQAGPVALDGKIKGLDENWIGDSILQVNGIDLKFPMTFADALQIIKDVVENPKFQTVQLVINQNVNISGYIRYGCHGNYNQYPI